MSHTNIARASTGHRIAAGFTLVELMITITVGSILILVALPNFREIGVRMNVTATTNDVVGALNTARTEAVKRGLSVAVVSNSGSSDWTSGWQIMADTARDGTYATTVIAHAALPATYTLAAKGQGGDDSKVVFGGTGNLIPANPFDFSVCRPTASANIKKSRRIAVQSSGEISSRPDVTGSPAGTC